MLAAAHWPFTADGTRCPSWPSPLAVTSAGRPRELPRADAAGWLADGRAVARLWCSDSQGDWQDRSVADSDDVAERARQREIVRRGYDTISLAYRSDDGAAAASSAEDVSRYAGWTAELAGLRQAPGGSCERSAVATVSPLARNRSAISEPIPFCGAPRGLSVPLEAAAGADRCLLRSGVDLARWVPG